MATRCRAGAGGATATEAPAPGRLGLGWRQRPQLQHGGGVLRQLWRRLHCWQAALNCCTNNTTCRAAHFDCWAQTCDAQRCLQHCG